MDDVTCFLVTETAEAEVNLRRFTASGIDRERGCPAQVEHNGYVRGCDATTWLEGRVPFERNEDGHYRGDIEPAAYAGDERWPTLCAACGQPFAEVDDWQVNREPIWAAGDGREWRQRSLPPGAMFDATWARFWGVGEDGMALTVVLPPGTEDSRGHWWHIDGPASGEGGVRKPNAWTRSGVPPVVTARPSILTSDFHGFLTEGVIRGC